MLLNTREFKESYAFLIIYVVASFPFVVIFNVFTSFSFLGDLTLSFKILVVTYLFMSSHIDDPLDFKRSNNTPA